MDTRTKILTIHEAIEVAAKLRQNGRPINLLTGYFDVLQPALIRRLDSIVRDDSTLFVIVLEPPAPLLSSAARAELAAALRVIDYVIRLDGDPSNLIDQLQPDTCFHDEQTHLESTEKLIAHVFERHGRVLARSSHH